MRWWEQEDLDVEGMKTGAWEAVKTEGVEERYGTETATDY